MRLYLLPALASIAACATPAATEKPPATSADSSLPEEKQKPAKPAPPKWVASDSAPDDVAAPPADALRTASGIAYRYHRRGDAEASSPGPRDTVMVHYVGWTTDGELFDSSYARRQPARFALDRVIPGWTEGVQLMRVGDAARFWIPAELAYAGSPNGPQGLLVFDVELLGVEPAPPEPVAPDDVAAPPEDAKRTESGIAYRVVKESEAVDRPNRWDTVTVHYSGWTTDGVLFDSSRLRDRQAVFPLTGVIPGWTEIVSMMSTGDRWIVWIPEELAYKGEEGKPQGMLVFDIELLAIERRPQPPETPKDVAKAPRRALRAAGGVRYRYLKKRVRKGPRPNEKDSVEIHYSGWTTDGKLFDSSVTRGQAATFPLAGVIPGFRTALQKMRAGDRLRCWIPEEQAYKGRSGPQGTLVFDIELIRIIPPDPEP